MLETDVEILDAFVQGKIDSEHCEDTLVLSDDFIGIIDGVTSKSNFRYRGQTTGKIASTLAATVLKTCSPKTDLKAFIELVNAQFNQFYAEHDFPLDRHQFGLQAVAVIYSKARREVWQIGDALVNINGHVHLNPKKSDLVLANFRSLVLNSESSQPLIPGDTDQGRELILPWILKATQFANNDQSEWGYAILNGEPIPEKLLRIYSVDVRFGSNVALASDGYPSLSTVSRKNAEAALAKVLQEDPMCYRDYKSTKGLTPGNHSFDDRSFVSFYVRKRQ